jgi:hypothetical protein
MYASLSVSLDVMSTALPVSGSLILDLADGSCAYLVGTWKGVFFSFNDAPTSWIRLGTYAEYGLIYASKFHYESASDTLTVATLGRSVWQIVGIKSVVAGYRTTSCPVPITLASISGGAYVAPTSGPTVAPGPVWRR